MTRAVLILFVLALSLQLSAQTIRIATYRYGNNSRLQSLQPFADHLRKKYKYDVSVKSYESVQTLITAMQHNEVDVAFINTFGYLLLEASGKHPMHVVATLKVNNAASDVYRTAIIAGPYVTANRLDDLKKEAHKLRLELVNKGSTSGYLVPKLALAGVGIQSPEQSFKSVLFSEIHDAAVDAVLNRMADVAGVAYSEYTRYVQEDITNKRKIRVLWLSPEIPYGPILFNNRFGSAVGGELLHSFTALHTENARAFEAIKSGWSETKDATRFITINGYYYTNFKKELGTEKELKQVLKQVMR